MATKAITQPLLNSPSWGQPLNDNFAAIATAFGDATLIATTAGVVPLSVTQIGHMCLRCTGALTGDLTLQVPNGTAGQWVVVNATTDAVPGTLRTVSITSLAGGTPIQIARGSARSVYADGTSNGVVFADTIIIPGSDNQIIYNDAGALTGSSTLTFDGAAVSVGGSTATTGASWSSGTATATVTFSSGQIIPVGSVVSITGVVPAGYNGSWVTTGTATANQVQFAVATNPGTYTTAGTISYGNLNLGGSKVGGIASQALAEAGTDDTTIMTPLRVSQAIDALGNPADYQSAQTSFVAAGSYTFTHSLGKLPSNVQVWIVCITASEGFSVGDWYGPIGAEAFADGANVGLAIAMNVTDVKTKFGASGIAILNYITGVRNAVTYANWRLVVRAWK